MHAFKFYIVLLFQAALCTALTALPVKRNLVTIFPQAEKWNSNLVGRPQERHSDNDKNTHSRTQKQEHEFGNKKQGFEVCTPLTNVEGTHYTVSVNVGTPPQTFDLIADTGSNNLVVASCNYWKGHERKKCFLSNESSTLTIGNGTDGPLTTILMFGNGPIESIIASDLVGIGNLSSSMKNGLFLMVNNQINFGSPFEGIIGFGLPEESKSKAVRRLIDRTDVEQNDTMRHLVPDTRKSNFDYIWTPHIFNASTAWKARFDGKKISNVGNPCIAQDGRKNTFCKKHPELQNDVTFLQNAGVNRFSLCFNRENRDGNGGTGGILRLNTPKMETTFGNIADYHWALNLEGISAGSAIAPKLCALDNMPFGQRSPCGAIIDSGTTYILGPTEQIHSLYNELCDQWPRCKQNFTALENAVEAARSAIGNISDAASWIINPVDKAMVFMAVLSDCDAWFDKTVGLSEIPSIRINLAGSGKNLTLELEAWSFIVSQKADELRLMHEDIPGYGQVMVNYTKTGRKTQQCKPAFGALNYITENNGPAWIFGLPIFYEYVVNFDTSESLPSLSFSKGPCGSCTKHDQPREQLQKRSTFMARQPRQVHGEPRAPATYDNYLF